MIGAPRIDAKAMALPPENEAFLLTREVGHSPGVGERPTGLPIDLLIQSVSRLRVLALLYAFVFFMTLFPALLLPPQRARMLGSFVLWSPGAISIAVALFVAALIRSLVAWRRRGQSRPDPTVRSLR
jgi:hypothetical protein